MLVLALYNKEQANHQFQSSSSSSKMLGFKQPPSKIRRGNYATNLVKNASACTLQQGASESLVSSHQTAAE
uniref:Uncharacterized protein n=1 Tax=Ditylenchus dipsaci TaxID=166011 RepID=A0A915CXJ5_9BILA